MSILQKGILSVVAAALLGWIVSPQTPATGAAWQFTVSGDSRNCGDIVMPAIAGDIQKFHSAFYWHLGDFRATYIIDEDIQHQPEHLAHPLAIDRYYEIEWQDFLNNQIAAFGDVPVYLGIGNHELYPPKTRDEFISRFKPWLAKPEIREQRLKDNKRDRGIHIYYHWHEHNVDFITMDNASSDQFDETQLRWIEHVLLLDKTDPTVATIVIGMHEALPDSLGDNHSMSDSPTGVQSGRRVYQDLLSVANEAHKHVYILASHSHFYMANIFNTDYIKSHGGVLPGWIVGTAGAVRYPLPDVASAADAAQTNVYGYLLANVQPDGTIDFQFHKLDESSVPAAIVDRYKQEFVHWCFEENSQAR